MGMAEKPNILIAVPAYGGEVKNKTLTSIVALTSAFSRAGIDFTLNVVDQNDISAVRNYFASYVIQEGQFTHLAFIDNDMVFRPSAFIRMLRLNKPVVGCVSPKRILNIARAIELGKDHDAQAAIASSSKFNIRNKDRGALRSGVGQVSMIGMAVALIQRGALQTMVNSGGLRTEAPGRFAVFGLKQCLYGFFDPLNEPETLYEDFSFCVRWTKLGGAITAIADEPIGHVGSFVYAPTFLRSLEFVRDEEHTP